MKQIKSRNKYIFFSLVGKNRGNNWGGQKVFIESVIHKQYLIGKIILKEYFSS